MGITGQDCVAESGVTVEEEMMLGFGKCKLCLQAPVEKGWQGKEDVQGGRICTR
jgi:ATP phosphoribosyltransferase